MNRFRLGMRQFFGSLWQDFANLFKKHYLKLIGLIISFIVPVVCLLTLYVQKVDNATKYTVPFAVIVPLVILILIYWGKAKTFCRDKLKAMKVENDIEKGKHAAAIILFETVRQFMIVLPFILCYLIIKEIQKYYEQVSNIFLFLVICEAVGGLFCILDTIHNVFDFEQIKREQ